MLSLFGMQDKEKRCIKAAIFRVSVENIENPYVSKTQKSIMGCIMILKKLY